MEPGAWAAAEGAAWGAEGGARVGKEGAPVPRESKHTRQAYCDSVGNTHALILISTRVTRLITAKLENLGLGKHT